MKVDKEEAPAGTGASDRRSDLMMGWRDLYGKHNTPQVETVDDLGWGTVFLFRSFNAYGYWD